jgi:ABC-type branched-subunit amino acid transport system substrate-binding protein
MEIRRRTVLAGAMAMAARPVIAQSGPTHGVTAGEIVLGSHFDLSGPLAVVTPPYRNGIQMRVDEANEAGGIHGRKLRLIIEDDASQPSQAVRVVDKMLKRDDVFAMVAPFGSGPNVATLKKIVESNVIVFAPFGASSLFRQLVANDPRLFTTMQNYDTSTYAGVKWAINSMGAKKIGFIYLEGQFGDVALKGLRQALAESQGKAELAAHSGFKYPDMDFSSHVQRMRAAGVDFIFGATPPRETVAVASELRKVGWSDVRFMTSTPGRTSLAMALGKKDVEGIYGLGSFPIANYEQASGPLKAWAESYKRRFNVPPDENAAWFYGYMDWFLSGVKEAGRDVTTEKVVKTLLASTYKGFASYEPQRFIGNHAFPEWVQVEQIEQGRWVRKSPLINPANTRS